MQENIRVEDHRLAWRRVQSPVEGLELDVSASSQLARSVASVLIS